MISGWKRLPVLAVTAAVMLSGCASGGGVLVSYDVKGTGETTVVYSDGDKSVTESVKLPWHKEFHVDKKKFTLQVQAGTNKPGGGVTACAASVDNQQQVYSTPINPAFDLVLCTKEYTAG
jgi:hypothetical protein